MLVHHSGIRSYLFTALGATPELCTNLLQGLSEEEADFSPTPERFTLREVVAHLADWETIFLARMRQTLTEEIPTLLEFDEGQRALDCNYARSDVSEQLRLFHEHRTHMIEFLHALSPTDWERISFHSSIGHMSMEALATVVPLHDSYHLRQIMDWRHAFVLYKSVLD